MIVQIAYSIRHSRTFKWNKRECVSALIVFSIAGIGFLFIAPVLLKTGLFIPALIYCITLSISLWLAIGTLWRKFFPRNN